jgi:hypothetical protein
MTQAKVTPGPPPWGNIQLMSPRMIGVGIKALRDKIPTAPCVGDITCGRHQAGLSRSFRGLGHLTRDSRSPGVCKPQRRRLNVVGLAKLRGKSPMGKAPRCGKPNGAKAWRERALLWEDVEPCLLVLRSRLKVKLTDKQT